MDEWLRKQSAEGETADEERESSKESAKLRGENEHGDGRLASARRGCRRVRSKAAAAEQGIRISSGCGGRGDEQGRGRADCRCWVIFFSPRLWSPRLPNGLMRVLLWRKLWLVQHTMQAENPCPTQYGPCVKLQDDGYKQDTTGELP